ncbi:hypothetical protein F3E40_23705 [Salmonella enterica subsp. enterica]|jgi:hypothetical protein|uniref:hypothetical protein n=1 Tax=Citrobacter TaxID=544 RepID=UPI0012838AC8|nr:MULTISPECIES: hypothetical protein [Citrobacter]ECA3525196.1 hypothetical protein [Salmonella enterica subsp. enterica serovar Telhashomer]ECF6833023.1 hypothetical protein [Salmonella enterica subsp. enterica]ECW0241977.1 hypothetical protein [Salmonella enterica subsp. enterica serovar Telhashomer]EGI6283357.1 hypothetical protein [Salmonella enterica subsp. enterica serovar Telhashomer]MBJ9240866.1 hypothetical protein [Citrobacter braakii]
MISNEDFVKKYPYSEFTYNLISSRAKGSMGQTDIDEYEIVNKNTGNSFKATRTNHTDLKTFKTKIYWE